MRDVGQAWAAALQQMLRKEKTTVTAAAKRLGVTRQAFHGYLNGKLPRRKKLNKAVHLWDLKFDIGEYSFSRGAFGPAEQSSKISPLPQPGLWDSLDSLQEDDLHLNVKRVGKVLRIDVRIDIPA